jgi:antitoxin component YwqK of YwqJK toxin-antitoxin module
VNYRNGKKNGLKSTYMDQETIRENFVNDIKEGFTRVYFPDGKLKMEIPFIKGLEQGYAKEYSEEGNIITLIEYKRGFIIDRLKINRRDKNNLKQGRWYTFWDNGKIKQEGFYRDDKKDGYFKDYTENGDLVNVFKYVMDEKQPDATEIKKLDVTNNYFSSGKIKSSGTFRDGIPEGIYREYDTTGHIVKSLFYQNGNITGEGIFLEDGTKDGPWKEFYADHVLKSQGEYNDGKQVGEWKFYYPDGKMEQDGKFSASGKILGTWKWYYNNGQLLREEEHRNGVKDGLHTEYDENGKIVEQGDYLNGEEDGPWFTIDGDYLERGNYRDGLKTGKWVTYYLFPNGAVTDSVLSFTGSFIDDNPDGKHTYYWDNGKVRDEGLYLMGKREGDWVKYNYDGTLFLIITYKNGVEVKYDGVKIRPPFEAEEP